MKKTTVKKKVGIIVVVVIAAVAITAAVVLPKLSADDGTELVYKETTVQKGNIIYGVTESGSVSVGTVEQDFDLELTSLTSSSTSSSSSGSGSSSGGSSAGGMTGTSTGGTSGSSGSSSSSSSSSSTTATLEVEKVYVTAGQVVSEGDVLLKVTDDSLQDARETLEDNVSTATLALNEAKLTAATSKLSAQYSYNSNVANGSVAEAQYNSTITELQNAVTSAQQAVDASATKIADYQTRIAAGEDCTTALAEEQVGYSTLCAKLTSAQNNLTTKSIQAEEDYEEAMLNYNNASALYSIDTNGISSDVSDAEDDLSDAKDALSEFEDTIGDGCIYAEYDGTIMSLGYAAGDDLSTSTAVATYSDSTAVTIAVSVTEEDISNISVGDEVYIDLTAYEDETFDGTVTSIDTSSSSGSSTVDYTVTVAFSGDVSKIYADMTGNVTFVIKELDDVLYVSDKAIINDGTISYVDIKKEDGTIERVEVTTGFSNGQNVEVQSGLTEGQTALIESQVSTE